MIERTLMKEKNGYEWYACILCKNGETLYGAETTDGKIIVPLGECLYRIHVEEYVYFTLGDEVIFDGYGNFIVGKANNMRLCVIADEVCIMNSSRVRAIPTGYFFDGQGYLHEENNARNSFVTAKIYIENPHKGQKETVSENILQPMPVKKTQKSSQANKKNSKKPEESIFKGKPGKEPDIFEVLGTFLFKMAVAVCGMAAIVGFFVWITTPEPNNDPSMYEKLYNTNNPSTYGNGNNPSFRGAKTQKGGCTYSNCKCEKYNGVKTNGYWPDCSCTHTYAAHVTNY